MSEREELTRLTGALAAHLRRRARRGVTRVLRNPARKAETRPQPPPATPAPDKIRFAAASEAEPTKSAGIQLPPTTREIADACADLASLRAAVAACTACDLCKTRKQTVFQDGSGARGVLFIGEAPGAEEDRRGLPFVGPAGELLTDIIVKGMQLRREEVAIANVLKCRPPENRDPSKLEKERCTPFLDRQIELLNPKVIIPLGRHASNHIMGTDLAMGRLRGRVHEVRGRKVVPTYHPAYLLRSPSMKRECWKDIQLANAELA